jgi:S-adenosylmethionine hydrolase
VTRLLTLTTDFGRKDAYVASLKGVILALAPPDVRLLDVSHDVGPQDIMEGAFVVRSALPYFPRDSVHLVVVDPGVGTSRRPVAAMKDGHYFVAPDNGILSLIFDRAEPEQLVVLDKREFWRVPDPSATFHARDIFAPVAAHIAAGRSLEEVGSSTEPLQPMHWALPINDEQGVQGWVVYIDHFGNCVTNITRKMYEERCGRRSVKCYVGNAIIQGMNRAYRDVASGDPVLLFGSDNCLEVAVNTGSASALLNVNKGDPVNLVFVEER